MLIGNPIGDFDELFSIGAEMTATYGPRHITCAYARRNFLNTEHECLNRIQSHSTQTYFQECELARSYPGLLRLRCEARRLREEGGEVPETPKVQ